MRAVVQRVLSSSVTVDGKVIGSIDKGIKVIIGICNDDTEEDIKYIKDKLLNLRIFEDEKDKMNLSVLDIKGDILLISQFTLYGDCRKGRRPNFMNAMSGDEAIKLYKKLISELKESTLKVETGIFGADMKVDRKNNGPVTILLESKKSF